MPSNSAGVGLQTAETTEICTVSAEGCSLSALVAGLRVFSCEEVATKRAKQMANEKRRAKEAVQKTRAKMPSVRTP